jgi:uncharacterized protein YprB with RNaseH-like and TPR domain
MQIEAQRFLRLTEKARTLVFLDIEATGLRGDYNSVLVVSIRPYGGEPESFVVDRPGKDKAVVKAAKARLEEADAWVTYYGKGFDILMLNTRLLRWGIDPIEKRPHIDMYWTLKSNILTAHRSQGHLLSWLKTPENKMSVSAEAWNEALSGADEDGRKALRTMVERCESDVAGLEALYRRTSHLIRDITR